MTDFLEKHKILTIGVIAYIVVFIVGMFFSPWETAMNAEIAKVDTPMVSGNIIKVFYCGIYELLSVFFYATTKFASTSAQIFCFLSTCAIFTYVHLLSKKFIDTEDTDNYIEKVAINYLYDNVLAYGICILMYYAFSPAFNGIVQCWNATFWIKLLIILLVAMVIILPAIPHFAQVFVYLLLVSKLLTMIDAIMANFENHIIIAVLLIFLISIVTIGIVNLVMSKVIEVACALGKELWIHLWGVIGQFILSTAIKIAIVIGAILGATLIATLISYIISKQ